MSQKFAKGSVGGRFLMEDSAPVDASGWLMGQDMPPESVKKGAKCMPVPAEGDMQMKFANGETPLNVSRQISVKKP